jgi:hypothetical protein
MAPVGTLTRPSSLRPTAHQALGVVIAAILAVAVLAAMFALVRGPNFVDHVTIDNRSNGEIHVVTSGNDTEHRLGLAVVDPDQRTRIDEVLDQGDAWKFELSNGRVPLGVLTISRAQLERDHWNVVIPASLGRD